MVSEIADSMRIALAQLNPLLGDLDGNIGRAIEARVTAAREKVDLVVFTELFITGYPPEDLIRKPAFLRAARAAVEKLAGHTADGGPAMLVGTPWEDAGKVYNAVALLDGGKVDAVRYKVDLPNYGVFDEKRVFDVGPYPGPIRFRGVSVGAPICEDIWTEAITECLAECGAEILIVVNGSPWSITKNNERMNRVVARVTETGLPLVYVNQVGGQDELAFDGASLVLNADASLAVQLPAWEEAIAVTEWRREGERWRCLPGKRVVVEEGDEAAYLA